MFPESDKQEENILQNTADSIKRLYTQIQKMPQLSNRAEAVDSLLLNRLQNLKGDASYIIQQLNEQKNIILKKFDNWIMPIAKEVLDNLLKDAEQLKDKLDDKLDHIEETTSEEWNDQARHWAQLYTKWQDRKGLIDKILEVVASRTKSLIDKDIKVIFDYQMQSLAHLPKESEELKTIEERLHHATAEPLKQLMALRHPPIVYKSIQQASEWVAKLQEKRESYFDQLLMRIDYVIKEVVHVEEAIDTGSFSELEGEIVFMEKELHYINADLHQIHLADESDRQFLAGRIESLLEHVEQLNETSFPPSFQKRVQTLKSEIKTALSHLQ